MRSNTPLQVGVKILLGNGDGKYLLVHRSAKKYPDVKDRWDLVGGRINSGTTLIKNLRREIKEETNLVLISNPKLIAVQDIIKEKFHVVRVTYLGRASGKVALDNKEHDSYEWFSLHEIKKLPGLDVYFKKLLDNPSLWK
jgi:ADP-ribose pyrophosphatase YjhB (NUDIX family)